MEKNQKTSKHAIHLFDVWYGTVAAKLGIELVHLDGIVKHHFHDGNRLIPRMNYINMEPFQSTI